MNINLIQVIKILFMKDVESKVKLKIIKQYFTDKKQNFIDYWFGYCIVSKGNIWCLDDVERLETISMIVGRFRKGQFLDNILAEYIPQMIEDIKENNRYYYINIKQGMGYQDYYLNRFQQKLLLKELEKIIKEEDIYKEEKNE